MRRLPLIGLILFLLIETAFADTPPLSAVKLIGNSDGTKIGNIADALKVNVTNSGGTSTVNQGTGGVSPWSVYFLTPPAVGQSGSWTTGRTWTLLNSTDSVTSYEGGSWNVGVSGTVTSNIGTTGGLALDSTLSTFSGKFTTTANGIKVDGSAVTQPVSAAALPLPTGAATSALQTTGNTALTTINTTLGSPFQAGGSIGNSSFGISGTLPAYASTPTFNIGTTGGLALDSSITSLSAKFGSLGQKTMAGSAPVVIASDQSAIPITGTVVVSSVTANQGTSPWVDNVSQFGGSNVVTGTGTGGSGIPRVTISNDSNILSTQSGTWNISNVSGTISLPTGAATSALQTTGNSTLTTINTTLGSPMQNSGGSVTANAGTNLNTSLLALESGGNLATTATNTGRTPINLTGSGSAAAATVSTVITLSAPANAIGFVLMCLDTSTANVRWAVGRTATTTLGQQLQPGRDTGFVPIGANVSLVAESGTQNYDIQWIAR